MSRLHTSFVLGYHGCEESVGRKAVNGEIQILQSRRDFDWLGAGAYFWESDPRRALEWAQEKRARGEYEHPFVIGAVIDLGNCLDLTNRDDLELVRFAADSFKALREKAGLRIPENKSAPKDTRPDRVLRFLDCAVINHLHAIVDNEASRPPGVEAFDTVRALLPEGDDLYPGAGFKDKVHCQIAVRNPKCIKGIFYPLGDVLPAPSSSAKSDASQG